MWDWLGDLFDWGGGADTGYLGGVDNFDTSGGSGGSWYDSLLSDWDGSGSFMEDMYSTGSNYGSGSDMGELSFPSYISADSNADAGYYGGIDNFTQGENSNGILGNLFSQLKKGVTSDTGKGLLKLGGSALLSYLGNKSTANANQSQAKSNLADYLSNVTWTPERSANYTNAVRSNTSGILSGALAQGKGTLAEQLASAGRGGGSYGKKTESMTRDMLNKMATATNSAIQTVNTPPNLSASAFNIPADTSTGDTLTSISKLLGSSYNQDQTAPWLSKFLNSILG